MDVSLNRRRKKVQVEAKSEYPLDLSLYIEPPTMQVPLEDFYNYAFNRVKLLRVFEVAQALAKKPYSTEWKEYIMQELHNKKLKTYTRLLKSDGSSKNPTEADLEARKEDYIAHFILRLAYCKDIVLRKWFLSRELELFKWRFSNLSEPNSKLFLQLHKIHYNSVSNEEKQELREELMESTSGNFIFEAMNFYKLHWTEMPLLVESRRTFLKDGFIFVPHFELVSIVAADFRSRLNESLTKASKLFHLTKDIRLTHFINNIHNAYVGYEPFSTNNADGKIKITSETIAQYAEHFPLCMKVIYDEFSQKHHLKHGARLQYMLFLKGAGMLFDDVMKYWREEFTKIIDDSQFDKKYSYSVKHAFGKVGKMQSYSAYNCNKIISSTVGPGECHGCPFKHWDNESLGSKLSKMGLNGEDLSEVMRLKTGGHFQIACTQYLQASRKNPSASAIEHPNQFFESSLGASTDKGKENKRDVKKTDAKTA